jgi:hypothetical protein
MTPELQLKAREIYKKFLKGTDPRDLAEEWQLGVPTICKYIKWAAEEIDTRFDRTVYKHQLDATINENLDRLEELYEEASCIRGKNFRDRAQILAEIRRTKELKGKIHSIIGSGAGNGAADGKQINIIIPNLNRGEGTGSVVVKEGKTVKGEVSYDELGH